MSFSVTKTPPNPTRSSWTMLKTRCMNWLEHLGIQERVACWSNMHGQYGLCDRLRGLACGLAWTKANRMRLLYGWSANAKCPATYESLFTYPAGVCRDPKDIPALPPRSVLISMPSNVTPWEFWGRLVPCGLDHGPYHSLDSFKEAWRSEIRSFKPVDAVRQNIDACLAIAHGNPLIGIHVRRTDVVNHPFRKEITSANLAMHDIALLDEVRHEARVNPHACFYLASDDHAAFLRWSGWLATDGIRFISHDKAWKESLRQTDVRDAVVDLWMLGHCQLVLGTVTSGFLMIAEALGAKPKLLKLAPA